MRIPVFIALTIGLAHCTSAITESATSQLSNISDAGDISEEQWEDLLHLIARATPDHDDQAILVFGFTPRHSESDAETWVAEYMNRIVSVAASPEMILADSSVKERVCRIGQEIYDLHGHEGMLMVCESNSEYKRDLEIAWDGIGSWGI